MKENSDKKRSKDLETIIVLSSGSLAFYFIFKKNVFVFLSFGLLLVSLVSSRSASVISDLWLKFSYRIGKVNNTVLLFISFYVFVTPVAFLYRLFVRDPLFLKKNKDTKTYFHTRNHSFKKEEFDKTW